MCKNGVEGFSFETLSCDFCSTKIWLQIKMLTCVQQLFCNNIVSKQVFCFFFPSRTCACSLSSDSRGSALACPSSHRAPWAYYFIFLVRQSGVSQFVWAPGGSGSEPWQCEVNRAQVVPLHTQMWCWDLWRCEGWGSANVSVLCSH